MWIIIIGHTEWIVRLWCVFVFHRTKHGNILIEQRLGELFDVKEEGVAGGMNKIAQWEAEWIVPVTESWWGRTERQWHSWGKGNVLEKLKYTQNFICKFWMEKALW